jgi:hypothetical protein
MQLEETAVAYRPYSIVALVEDNELLGVEEITVKAWYGLEVVTFRDFNDG